jgi:hypothetical protein
MSTQTKFDLDGLSYAVGAQNAGYQLALYADDAEVEIVDAENPAVPIRVLRGKNDIREWLDSMASGAVRYQVTDAEAHQHQLRFTEECRYPDGSDLRYECRAEVYRGRITRASVALVCAPRHQVPGARAGGARDGGPGSVEGGSVGRRTLTQRHLPGNYLG